MSERLAEIPGRCAGHAERGQRLDFVEAQRLELAEGDRIDVRVVRSGAVPRHEQRHALVQIVHDRRMPFEEHARHGPRALVHQLVRIAIDVDESVLRPVGRRLARQRAALGLALQEAVKPFDHLVAPVRVRHRVDQHDQVPADALDHRLLGHREPIRELQHGFGRTGFVRMQRGVEVVDRPCAGHDLLGGARIRNARIGQCRGVALQLVERGDALLVRNRQQHDVAPFLRSADREDLDARRRRGERACVAVGSGRIDELARRAGNPLEEGARRRHRGRGGQIRDPGRKKLRRGGGPGDVLDRAGLGRIRRRVLCGCRDCAECHRTECDGENRGPTDDAH